MEENEREQPQKDFEIKISDLDEGKAAASRSSSLIRKLCFSPRPRRLFLILFNGLLILLLALTLGNTVSVRTLVSNALVRSTPTFLVVKASPQASSPTNSLHRTLGAPACRPPSPLDNSNIELPEAQGTTPVLWSLFLDGIPTARTDNKVVWRIDATLQGPPQVVALGPYGQHLLPLPLNEHDGSNWNRPGSEWGTLFNFPVAGCWDLRVTAGTVVGDVWIVVS